MSERIHYQALRRLLDRGAQLVEVLPAEEYAEEHLPGAINIPLKQLDADSTEQLNKSRPVIVYCWDYLCDMSPRAARRLETLGFQSVYDYAPSKVDYMARGLPTEGEKANERRAAEVSHDDVVTASMGDRIGAVKSRVDASPYGFSLVTDGDRILLGRLRRAALAGDPQRAVEEVMEAGPSTVRADTRLDDLRQRLDRRGLKTALVSTPDGVLLGVVRGGDLDQT
jgi:rhodanese-related sulfurtransferase